MYFTSSFEKGVVEEIDFDSLDAGLSAYKKGG